MVDMKHGDEDLVEDEASLLLNNNKISKPEPHEDYLMATSEQKEIGNIPLLIGNNGMIPTAKPFSERLKGGELDIDLTDIHAIANQMIFEINLMAGKSIIL